ncbi:MAG: S9 family peptidase, partial [Longimicrobiales bacterium]
GRTVVFTGYPYTIQTYHVAELYAIGLDGGGMRMITPELDRPVNGITWAADGGSFYFAMDDEGTRNVFAATLDGTVRPVTEGEHLLSLGSIGSDIGVGVRSAPHEPGDVVRFDLGGGSQLTELTQVNDDVLDGIRLGEVEELWFEAPDGTRAQGWIVKPPSFDASRDYPLVMEIHGGPHGMYNVGFNYMYQNFAANDYVVLYTNPRGSTGYGTEFGNAIDDAYPSVDYDDLIAGVDALVAQGYIDTDRMFVGGCSGGGVLSSWVIGHTDRFAAAAVRCPVIDWISFAGTADVALWGYNRFRSKPWEDPEKWLHHSPLMYAPNVKTPTLIMTGELDLRTPMAQSEEYFQALKVVGVPVKLVRFNEEYHGTGSKPSNFMRTQLLMMKWYETWGGENRWRRTATQQ